MVCSGSKASRSAWGSILLQEREKKPQTTGPTLPHAPGSLARLQQGDVAPILRSPPRALPREDREQRHPSPRRRGLVRAKQAASAQSRPRPALTSKPSRRIHPQLLPNPSSPLSFLGIQQPRAGKQPVIKASWEGGMEEAAAFLTKPERSDSATSFPSPCER